jgi:hypothetical protein
MMLGLLLAYCGLSALCLSMDRPEARQRPGSWPDWPRVSRLVGWSLIAASFTLCLVRGQGAGVATWFGFMSISGVLLAMLRPHAPHALRVLAVAAAAIAVIVVIAKPPLFR